MNFCWMGVSGVRVLSVISVKTEITAMTAVMSNSPSPMARRRGLLAIILVFVAIVATHLDAVPIWDAKNYWICVQAAVHAPFNPLNFRCNGHPNIVYMGFLGVTQYVWPWNLSVVYIVNALLGAASIAAFDALLRVLFPN